MEILQKPTFIKGYSNSKRNDVICFPIIPSGTCYDDDNNEIIIKKQAIKNSEDKWIGKPMLINHKNKIDMESTECGEIFDTFYYNHDNGIINASGDVEFFDIEQDGVLFGVAVLDLPVLEKFGINLEKMLFDKSIPLEEQDVGVSCTFYITDQEKRNRYRGGKKEFTFVNELQPAEVSFIQEPGAEPRYEECRMIANSIKKKTSGILTNKNIQSKDERCNFMSVSLKNYLRLKNAVKKIQNDLEEIEKSVIEEGEGDALSNEDDQGDEAKNKCKNKMGLRNRMKMKNGEDEGDFDEDAEKRNKMSLKNELDQDELDQDELDQDELEQEELEQEELDLDDQVTNRMRNKIRELRNKMRANRLRNKMRFRNMMRNSASSGNEKRVPNELKNFERKTNRFYSLLKK